MTAETAAAPARRLPRRPGARFEAVDQRLSTIAFWALLAIGMALRIVLLFTNAFTIDSDNGVVFLVAKHISEGDIAWFFWGQTYGGTLLEMVAGVFMLPFGAHIEVLAIVGALFFAGVALLVRQIAIAAFGRPVVGNVAGILFWFSGYWMARVGTSEPGFYGPSLLLGLLTIWLVLRGDRKKSYLQWALIGLAAGLALWQSPMGIALAAPAVLVALIRQPSITRWLVGAAAAVVGALPWLIALATTADVVKPQRDTPIVKESFYTFFTRMLPSIFSIDGSLPRIVFGLVAVVLLVLLVALAVWKRSWWLGTLLGSTLAVYLVIVAGTAVVLQYDSVRYSIFVLPAIVVALAWVVTLVPFAGLVAMAAAVAATVTQTYQLFPDLRFSRSETYIVGDISALGDYLVQNDITHSYGDYWISYSVTAATNEEVTVAPISGHRRYDPYETSAAAAPTAVVIVLLDNDNDRRMSIDPKLPPSTRTVVADYAIYTFEQPFDVFDYQWDLY